MLQSILYPQLHLPTLNLQPKAFYRQLPTSNFQAVAQQNADRRRQEMESRLKAHEDRNNRFIKSLTDQRKQKIETHREETVRWW